MTKKSNHPYYHVIIGKNQESVTLCILNGNGEGGYDHWRIDKTGHERTHEIEGGSFFQDYWIDYVDSKIIGNVYSVLDFYVKLEDNVEELKPTVLTLLPMIYHFRRK